MAASKVWALLFMAASCSTPSVRPELRAGALDITGQLGASVAGGSAGAGSSASALGLNDEAYVEPRVELAWGAWHVIGSAFNVEYSGTGTTQAGIDLGVGPGIGANQPVQTEADFTLAKAEVLFDLLPLKSAELGIGAGVGWLIYDLEMRSLSGPGSVSTGNDVPFVYLAGAGRVNIARFELAALASGIVWRYGGEEISFYDVEARAGYRLWEGAVDGMLSLGWRFLGIDYEYSDRGRRVFADFDFNGPYLSFLVEF